MADWLTHTASGRLLLIGQKDAHIRWMFLWGTVWPDLLSKSFFFITRSKPAFCYPTHSVAGLILTCYAFVFLFEESRRQKYFLAMTLGSFLHVLVDMFKNDFGYGDYLFYPFTTAGFEFGVYWSEDIVYMMPGALAVILVLEGWERWRRKP